VPTNYTPDDYLDVCNSVREQLKSAMDAITWEKAEIKKLN
jgi:hypothetical protein